MSQVAWCGPLFVVGLPRSGTKLLRDLLNNHPLVKIPRIETEFLPLWISQWKRYGDLSDYSTFREFYDASVRFSYFQYQRTLGQVTDPVTWFNACEDYSVASVFEALVRNDTRASRACGVIWGDKSPSYVRHISCIASTFPEAKFVHIIRDVRDYCLSIEKAWGKNKIRAAQRWTDSIAVARRDAERLSERYLEIRYEDLLSAPEVQLTRICDFLGIQFEKSMIKLDKSAENIGDTKGERHIIQENQGKYLKRMSPSTQKTIELISGDILFDMGYLARKPAKRKRVSRPMMSAYQSLDGVNLLRASIQRRGLVAALRYWLSGVMLISKMRSLTRKLHS